MGKASRAKEIRADLAEQIERNKALRAERGDRVATPEEAAASKSKSGVSKSVSEQLEANKKLMDQRAAEVAATEQQALDAEMATRQKYESDRLARKEAEAKKEAEADKLFSKRNKIIMASVLGVIVLVVVVVIIKKRNK